MAALLVLVVALLFSAISFIMMGQGVLVLLVFGVAFFLALQFGIFQLVGLRSRADHDAEGEPASDDDDSDWRAWRG